VSADDKVLVVGPSWVGDMVMAQALYRSIKQRSERTRLHVLAPPWSLPVIARMPEVERAIELPVGHGELKLGARRALGVRLRAERYRRSIVLPRSFKAALVPWFARIPRRTGFRGEWRYGLLNDIRPFDGRRLDQTVKRFVALGFDDPADMPQQLPREWQPRLQRDPVNLARLRGKFDLAEQDRLVALMPGAEYGPAKRWPAPSFGELAAQLAASGVDVIVLGSAKEHGIGEEIRAVASHSRVRNLCGATTLADVVDLTGAAGAAVSNDSGLMHVAAAAGTHVVALYGSSSPAFTPPLSETSTVLYLGIECSPCFERDCPLGHLRCLREISVRQVLAATDEALGEVLDERASGRGESV
jgi:lipopolysaccharide heptosyltransferase II